MLPKPDAEEALLSDLSGVEGLLLQNAVSKSSAMALTSRPAIRQNQAQSVHAITYDGVALGGSNTALEFSLYI